MNAARDFHLRDNFGVLGVFDIEDRRAVGRVHVTDVSIAVLDDHLAAPRHVRSSDLFYVFANAKLGQVCFAHEYFSC